MLPTPVSDIQPIFCLTDLIIPSAKTSYMTRELLALKRNFYPNIYSQLEHDLQILLHEIKGSTLRSDIRNGNRNRRRRAFGIIDKTLRIIETCEAKIIARIYIKNPGDSFDGKAVYTSSIQAFYAQFQAFLNHSQSRGVVLLDSRNSYMNSNVSYSIFTKKYRLKGDAYDRIPEAPMFGHSENSAGLQIVDLIASAILTPIAVHTYCLGHIHNVHVHEEYQRIKERFASRMQVLNLCIEHPENSQIGIKVCDAILKSRSAAYMFDTANTDVAQTQ